MVINSNINSILTIILSNPNASIRRIHSGEFGTYFVGHNHLAV